MARTGVPTLYSLGDNEATDCHRMKSRGDYTSRGGANWSQHWVRWSPLVPHLHSQ